MSQSESTSYENTNTKEYIHGFTETEQNRLIRQSKLFEPYFHTAIDFAKSSHILELGCGIGAQIKLLLNRYSNLKITGIDISEFQINRAREFIKAYSDFERVSLYVGEGKKLPFADNTFDGAVVFFVLEHTEDPVGILQELRRVMQSKTHLYCTEVFNHSLYISPPCPSVETYWKIFNHYQRELNGDPDIGIKLCNLALKAGFSATKLQYIPIHLDGRNTEATEREVFLDYWIDLFQSAAPGLLSKQRITNHLLEAAQKELNSIKHNPELVFTYIAMQLKALK